jgi:HK97 family phage major capsid protein
MPLDNPDDDVLAELRTATTGFEKAAAEVREFANKAREEIKSLGSMSQETKKGADEALLAMNELNLRVAELEQKSARSRGFGGGLEQPAAQKSLGQLVIESEEFKAKLLGKPNVRGSAQMHIETRAIMSGTASWGSTVSASNSMVPADRQDFTLMLPRRQLTVRDLVAPGTTTSNAIEYAVQTTRTLNAAPVAEGAAKPYSNLAFDLRSFPVRTIAHMFKVSRQILDDAPALRSIIDSEGRFGISIVEEAQMLYGDGTGQNLLGIVPQATAYSAPATVPAPETAMDRLRMAMLQAANSFLPVTGHVLNPNDWTLIELLKDSAGRYIIGDPMGSVAPRLWGLPVVATVALNAGTFLTGSFAQAAQVFDRMSVEVLISSENVDDFEKNLLSARIEERLAFVVKRPAAFITGNLPT